MLKILKYVYNVRNSKEETQKFDLRQLREIMMGEGNKQPPLCWLPLWVVELGLVAESCQHNSSTP